MERQYQLSVKSDTTEINVSSVNAEEVARIVHLAGIVEPYKPSDSAIIPSDPTSAMPADRSTPMPTEFDVADDNTEIANPDAEFDQNLNDMRKNAGLAISTPSSMSRGTIDAAHSPVQEGNGRYSDEFDDEFPDDFDDDLDNDFADPHGHSALRAAGPDNPRNLSCPTCNHPNQLTAKDAARGYQCDRCADASERGGDIEHYDMDEMMSIDEDVAEYDFGHKKVKDEGEEINQIDLIWQAVENPQRIKGSAGDNGLIQELHTKMMSDYADYLAEDEHENDTGVLSPLSDPTKPSFDKDPLSDEVPVDDGSHSPMSTIVRQHAFK